MIDALISYSKHVNAFLVLVPITISIIKPFGRNIPYSYIIILLFFGFVIDLANGFIIPVLDGKNAILLHIYTLSEFIILALFFRTIIYNNTIKKGLFIVIIVFGLFKMIDMVWITGTEKLDSLAITISSLFFTGLSLYFYWQTFQRLEVESLERYPLFWINTGILFYFAGNLITFIFSNYITQQGYEYFITHWLLHNLFSLFKYIAFSIGLWLLPRPQRISLS